jgi:ribosomal protein S18 acetylase RimI-like enzyme
VGYDFGTATEDDWPLIIDWQAEIVWVGMGPDRRRATSPAAVRERVARHVAQLRADEGFPSQVLIARAPTGELAGYVWVARGHNDRTGQMEASLIGQYVARAYRDRGLGGQLLELAEDWARAQGLPSLSLFVGAGNTIAQRLYRSLGYEVDTLRMCKPLTAPGASDGPPL